MGNNKVLRLRPIGLVFAALMLDCATLTAIPTGVCGNGVIDATEDCDTFPAACGRPDDGARACRLTCDRAVDGSCPVGWGCSVEGVCRQATGSFDPAGTPTSAGVVTLLAGDFDGDGRADLFGGGPRGGSSKPRVHFFDGAGVAAEPIGLQYPMSTPVVRDLNGDGRDDLAYGFNADNRFGAIGLLAGTADRAFSPLLVPSVTRPATSLQFASVRFDPLAGFSTPNGQGGLVTLERTSAGTFFRSISGANVVNVEELEQAAPCGPEQVVGAPVSAVVFSPTSVTPASACGEVVFAYNDADTGHLAILSPCAQIGKELPVRWLGRPARDVPLPAKVTGSLLVADIDGGYPEVFVTTAAGTLVASSDGNTLGAFKKLTDESGNDPLPTPLAVTDLDRDGRLDIVLPTGVFVSGTPGAPVAAGAPDGGLGQTTQSVRPAAGRWADVRVGNFNGDSLPDMVAVSPEALEIEFFANAGNSLFTRFSVPSSEPIRAITTGDFDGDRLQDIAFLASTRALGDTDVSGEAQLSIAYGKATGGPEPARVIGRFKEARGLTTVHQVNRTIDELVVVEAAPGKDSLPTTAITYVYGSGDRQAIAPLAFRDDRAASQAGPNQLRIWAAASLVAAPLVTPGSVDLLSVASGITARLNARNEGNLVLPFPTGVWFAGVAADGSRDSLREIYRFDAKLVRGIDDARFQTEGVIDTLIVGAAGDVDSPPDGVAELVTITRGTKAATSNLSISRKVDLEAGKPPTQVELADLAVSGGDDELALIDLDADDRADAVLITRGRNRERLRVYLNDGKGAFSGQAIVLDLPTTPGPDGRVEGPVAFTRIITGVTSAGKPRAELAVVTPSKLVLARVNDARTGFEVRDLSERLGLPLSGKISSIAAGDFDGDGVQDLAIADAGSIRLVRQQPRLK